MVIETVVNGRPITTQRRNSAGTQIGRINRAYDPHGRMATLTDDRNGTSTWQYYTTNDLVRAVVTPPSGTGDPSRTTLNEYDVVGRVNLGGQWGQICPFDISAARPRTAAKLQGQSRNAEAGCPLVGLPRLIHH